MQLETHFDYLFDFALQNGIVVANFVSQERQYNISLVLPKEVQLLNQCSEELQIEVVDTTLEGSVIAFT